MTVLGGKSATGSSILSNVSKRAFEVNVNHRHQDIHAQSVLDQLNSLSRQKADLVFETPIRQPFSNLIPSEIFSMFGKSTRCI